MSERHTKPQENNCSRNKGYRWCVGGHSNPLLPRTTCSAPQLFKWSMTDSTTIKAATPCRTVYYCVLCSVACRSKPVWYVGIVDIPSGNLSYLAGISRITVLKHSVTLASLYVYIVPFFTGTQARCCLGGVQLTPPPIPTPHVSGTHTIQPEPDSQLSNPFLIGTREGAK